ncbi:MAG: cotH 1 [Planctomycetaceae bacterium]|nr:cotH 1 [Planctomycetaceae bacterium]
MFQSGRIWLCAGVGILCGLIASLPCSRAADPLAAPKSASDSDVFGLTVLHKFQLQISAKDYAAMEPKGGGMPFGPGGPPGGPGRPGPGGPPAPGGMPAAAGFGFVFDSVHARLQADDQNFEDVGVRYKGNATYMMSSRLAKRSFKIDFDRYKDGASFHGIKKLNLHCGVLDSTKIREALAYAVFRAAGVPAPRTALAEVNLTVPGRYDAEYLGLYSVVEQVDKAFLTAHFKSDKGILLKPEGMRGISFLGDDPAAYKKPFDGKTEGDDQQWRRLVDFAKLINQADKERFQKEIGTFLDIEAFLRYLAANTLLVNFDSFMGMGHNYYLYLVPATNKFVFIPWDLDLAFGSHPMFGPMDQQINMSIDHPQLGEINLIDRLLALPDVKQAFREEIRRLMDTVFNDEVLGKEIDAIKDVSKDPLAREQLAVAARKEGGGFGPGPGGPGPMFGGTPMSLRTFVQKRSEAVASQLAGQNPGIIPRPSFGPGGPGGPGGGFGRMLARPLLNASDKDQDGKLSKAEIETAAAELLTKWDKDGNGQLDEKELEAAINGLMPSPQFGPPGGPNRGPANRP